MGYNPFTVVGHLAGKKRSGAMGKMVVVVVVVAVVVDLVFLNNNYCWQPGDVRNSSVAQKLLFLNKKMILLIPAQGIRSAPRLCFELL